MPSVITANDLRSGTVVYLTEEGSWAEALGDAAVAPDRDTLDRLEAVAQAAAERSEVTAIYAFDVRLVDGRPVPTSVREQIRAGHAPTV